MTGESRQPSHEPPRGRRKKQAPVTLIKQWKERGRTGEGRQPPRSPHAQEKTLTLETLTKTPSKRYNALWRKSTRNPGARAYITNR